MAVTDTHFLELDATDANDIALSKGYTHAFAASKVQVPPIAFGAPLTVAQGVYTRTWTFTNVPLTRAQHDALIALAVTETTVASTYPRLNVMDAEGTPNTWDAFTVDLDSLSDGPKGNDEADNRLATLTFSLRQTSGGFTLTVAGVTVYLDGLESIQQALDFSAPQTLTGDGESRVGGARALTATFSGWVATGSLNTLQTTLDAQAAVEVTGEGFDTAGAGYFTSEIPSTATAFLVSLSVDGEQGAMAHVTLVVSHDRA